MEGGGPRPGSTLPCDLLFRADCARALEHLKMLEFQNLDLNLSPFWAKAQTSKPCVESQSLYVFLSVARFSCWETLAA